MTVHAHLDTRGAARRPLDAVLALKPLGVGLPVQIVAVGRWIASQHRQLVKLFVRIPLRHATGLHRA